METVLWLGRKDSDDLSVPISALLREGRRVLVYTFFMPNFRRFYIPNALVFITCVTYQRIHYLEGQKNLDIFWKTLRDVQDIHPFHLLTYVILPDHFHWVMQVPEDQPNFSRVIHSLKRNFSINLKKSYGMHQSVHLWQDRFWDHIIRNEEDLERHFDYIHWNPVKHKYVHHPEDWEESTLTHWISKGYYPASWGSEDEPKDLKDFIIAE